MAAAASTCALALLDVLEQLPRDTLRDNIWQHLRVEDRWSDPDDVSSTTGRAFRLASQRSRQLADHLTRRLQLVCSEDGLESHGAFIARLDGLADLSLTVEGAEEDGHYGENLLVRTLVLGGATCQRLLALRISADCPLTAVAGRIVQLCCPGTRELHLSVASPEVAAFLQPLRTCQGLAKVSISSFSPEGDLIIHLGPAVAALGHMHQLRWLHLEGDLDASEVDPLAALTGLRHLNLAVSITVAALGDGVRVGRVLGALTQLEELNLPWWQTSGEATVEAVSDSALAQLGGLRQLTCLHSGGTVRAGGFTALRQMTALTKLISGPMSEELLSGSGHLPGLQHLCICGPQSGRVLAASLRPFLPLPQLTSATFCVHLGGRVAGEVDADSDGQGAADAFQFAKILAAAPRLVHTELRISFHHTETMLLPVISAAGAAVGAALLLPLHERITALALSSLLPGSLEVMWPALCGARILVSLHIVRSQVPEKGLLVLVGQHLPALRTLHVSSCTGVSGDTTVALAGLRMEPLRVSWMPIPSAAQRRAFSAAARPGVTLRR